MHNLGEQHPKLPSFGVLGSIFEETINCKEHRFFFLNRPLGQVSLLVAISMCVVFSPLENLPQVGLETFLIKKFLWFFYRDCLKVQFLTSLPWVVGELAVDCLWLWLWQFNVTSTAPKQKKKKTDSCFYPHWSRNSVSPICKLFLEQNYRAFPLIPPMLLSNLPWFV